MKFTKLNRLTLVVLTIAVMLFSLSISAFASPESLPKNIESTSQTLVALKAPDTESLSTTNKVLPVSAMAPQGAVVTIYRYSAATDTYNKVYSGDLALESTVGATMLFASQVELSSGTNKLLVRSALDDNTYQVVKFEATLLNEGFMDKIKSIAGMIFN